LSTREPNVRRNNSSTGSGRAVTGAIRWLPRSTLNSFGVTTSCGLLQLTRHEARMRCPISRVVRIKGGEAGRRHGVATFIDSVRVRLIASPSFTIAIHDWVK
jgi:hypothetical protein